MLYKRGSDANIGHFFMYAKSESERLKKRLAPKLYMPYPDNLVG